MQITFRLALSYVLAKFTRRRSTEKSKNWFPRDSRYSPLILRDPSNLNRKKKEKEKQRKRERKRRKRRKSISFSNDFDTKKLTRKRGPKDRFIGRYFQGSRDRWHYFLKYVLLLRFISAAHFHLPQFAADRESNSRFTDSMVFRSVWPCVSKRARAPSPLRSNDTDTRVITFMSGSRSVHASRRR